MKALLTHCKNFKCVDYQEDNSLEFSDCIVLQITFEKGDSKKIIQPLVDETLIMSRDVGKDEVILFPFAHLSNNLLDPEQSRILFEKIYTEFKKHLKTHVLSFNTNKEFIIDAYGHPGNVRFRNL